jgi:uncharacterized membrane protein YeiH
VPHVVSACDGAAPAERRRGDVFGFNVIAFNAAIPPTGPALEKLSADIGGHFALPRDGVVSHHTEAAVSTHGAA